MKACLKFFVGFNKVFLIFLLLLLYPATGFSLDNHEWSTGLNFQFYPPGARALGMGGAFVGLADDATAAASNPAGLAQLERMQLAIEGRYISRDKEEKSYSWRHTTDHGTGTTASEVDDLTDLSFGAFTTPLFNNLFSLSVFYDKPINYSSDVTSDRTGQTATVHNIGAPDISLDEVGLSLAKSFCDGRLLLGFGAGLQFFDFEGVMNRTQSPPFTRVTDLAVDESDTGLSWRAGILVKPIDNLRLGANFTMMPSFDYTIKDTSLPASPNAKTEKFDTTFDVPDTLSLGAAYNIFPNWIVLLEGKYIMYSQLMNHFAVLFNYGEDAKESEYSIDNVMEIHFGTEYMLSAVPNVPIFLRAGLFYEPAHDLEYNGTGSIQRGLFDGGDDLMHYTVGTGAVFANHFQVDVAADITEESRNVTLSMVYQF